MLGDGSGPTDPVDVAGRLMTRRVMGGRSFATLQDAAGTIQLTATRDAIGETAYGAFTELGMGDLVAAEGPMIRTRSHAC